MISGVITCYVHQLSYHLGAHIVDPSSTRKNGYKPACISSSFAHCWRYWEGLETDYRNYHFGLINIRVYQLY